MKKVFCRIGFWFTIVLLTVEVSVFVWFVIEFWLLRANGFIGLAAHLGIGIP